MMRKPAHQAAARQIHVTELLDREGRPPITPGPGRHHRPKATRLNRRRGAR